MTKNHVNQTFISTLLTALIPVVDDTTALRNILRNIHLCLDVLHHRPKYSLMLTLILSTTVLMSIVPFEAQAAGGSYTLKWYAADPSLNNAPYLPTYAKLTPAQLPSPGTAGRYADPSCKCSSIWSYFFHS